MALTPTPQSLVKTSIYPEKREEDKKELAPINTTKAVYFTLPTFDLGKRGQPFFLFPLFWRRTCSVVAVGRGRGVESIIYGLSRLPFSRGNAREKGKRKIRESRRDRRRSKTLPHADIFSVAKSKLFRDFGFVLLKKIGRNQCNIYFGGRRFRLNWIYPTQKLWGKKKEGKKQ